MTGAADAVAYAALRTDVGAAPVARDLLVVDGPDAESYLQGQLSQDVGVLVVAGPARSFLLQPTGKVDAWLRVARLGADRFVLDVDGGWGEAVLARLQRFKLRVKADLELLEGWRTVAVRGPGLGAVDLAGSGAELILPADWPGLPGADLVGPEVTVPADVTEVPPAVLEAVRIECGVPAMGAELDEGTIPAEAGAWVIEASVSFTKGCYTGQELVARIDSRGGNVPRHLRGVVVPGAAAPPVGAEVVVDGRVVGALTSVAHSPGLDAHVALAPVARAVDRLPAAAVVRSGVGDVEAEIRPLPLA